MKRVAAFVIVSILALAGCATPGMPGDGAPRRESRHILSTNDTYVYSDGEEEVALVLYAPVTIRHPSGTLEAVRVVGIGQPGDLPERMTLYYVDARAEVVVVRFTCPKHDTPSGAECIGAFASAAERGSTSPLLVGALDYASLSGQPTPSIRLSTTFVVHDIALHVTESTPGKYGPCVRTSVGHIAQERLDPTKFLVATVVEYCSQLDVPVSFEIPGKPRPFMLTITRFGTLPWTAPLSPEVARGVSPHSDLDPLPPSDTPVGIVDARNAYATAKTTSLPFKDWLDAHPTAMLVATTEEPDLTVTLAPGTPTESQYYQGHRSFLLAEPDSTSGWFVDVSQHEKPPLPPVLAVEASEPRTLPFAIPKLRTQGAIAIDKGLVMAEPFAKTTIKMYYAQRISGVEPREVLLPTTLFSCYLFDGLRLAGASITLYYSVCLDANDGTLARVFTSAEALNAQLPLPRAIPH